MWAKKTRLWCFWNIVPWWCCLGNVNILFLLIHTLHSSRPSWRVCTKSIWRQVPQIQTVSLPSPVLSQCQRLKFVHLRLGWCPRLPVISRPTQWIMSCLRQSPLVSPRLIARLRRRVWVRMSNYSLRNALSPTVLGERQCRSRGNFTETVPYFKRLPLTKIIKADIPLHLQEVQ